MDKQIEKTIQGAYGDLSGTTTDKFYEIYCRICETDGVKQRAKNAVIREACAVLGIKTKAIVYRVFE